MYGINLTAKSSTKVLVLGNALEHRKGTPVFGRFDLQSNATRLMTADTIKANWKAWASELFRNDARITPEEAQAQGIEIL